jgi:hypothetical protein
MSRLLLAGGRPAIEISAQEAGAALSQARIEPVGYPDAVPELMRTPKPNMACAGYLGAANGSTPDIAVETHDRVAGTFSLPPDQSASSGSDGVVTADRVTLPGGHAAVVRALQDNGSGLVYVVTDQGFKHPLPLEKTEQILSSLGFAGVPLVSVPASILALVPTAPALDPEAASRFAPVPTVSPSRPPNG